MKLEKTLITNQAEIAPKHEAHEGYEYRKHLVLPKEGNQCTVAIMEIPPLKSAYPCHYHVGITEVFYFISGAGLLTTPEGDRAVSPGDVAVFPPGAPGAHKITNTSASEPLRYVDFDTTSAADVVFYPDSEKVGLILDGKLRHVFRENSAVGYYEGE